MCIRDSFYTQAYPNAADYNLLTDGPDVQGMYSVYQEGIYLDYRDYETRYEDAVMGTGNAGDYNWSTTVAFPLDRKSTRLNSSHSRASRMPSSA